MNDLRPPWIGSMDDKHHPWWVRRTAVSKRGLKGALVVVEVVVVVTTTATPSTFDTWTKGHLRLSSDLRRPRSLGSLLGRGSGGNHH